jgi:hypothetical protein
MSQLFPSGNHHSSGMTNSFITLDSGFSLYHLCVFSKYSTAETGLEEIDTIVRLVLYNMEALSHMDIISITLFLYNPIYKRLAWRCTVKYNFCSAVGNPVL